MFHTIKRLQVLIMPLYGVIIGTRPITLSFIWTLADHYMMLGVDGLYHDLKELKYHCLKEEGNYTYQQVASIFESNLNVNSIPSSVAKVMIMRVLDYASPKTLLEIRALPWEQHSKRERGKEVEIQEVKP